LYINVFSFVSAVGCAPASRIVWILTKMFTILARIAMATSELLKDNLNPYFAMADFGMA